MHTSPSAPTALKAVAAMAHYLSASDHIDVESPGIRALAHRLAQEATSELDLIGRSFEFVRDEIRHSFDFKLNPVTCRASDVLLHGTGYCYAKSHLLAALLRANGIPAGLCYQRLSIDGIGAPFCLHGLNAVYIKGMGWYRLDARGNRAGVDAQFRPPQEQLAFPVLAPQERDLPEIWPEPLPAVVEALARHDTYDQLYADLPDLELADIGYRS